MRSDKQAFHLSSLLTRLGQAKTTYRRLKSLLILICAALAIYLTGQLWFVNLSNHNFFLHITYRFQPPAMEGYREFVRPRRVVYGDGIGRFNISYSGIFDPEPHDYFDTVLSQLFNGGAFQGQLETDFTHLLSRPMLKYTYAFEMPGALFPLGFGQRTGAFLTSNGVEGFESVIIWLPDGDADDIRVFFVNGLQTWEFSTDLVPGEGFPITPVSTAVLYYVSSDLEGVDGLSAGTFLPRIGGDHRTALAPALISNPYRPHHGVLISFVLSQVAPFFDNPATINDRVAPDGVWTFSNVHTTVRYFATEVLEYASFRPRRHVPSSMMGDFSAALAFIRRDEFVRNDFYLQDFEPHGDGYIFRFGYIVGNFPLVMPDGWNVSSADDILRAPIEVTVSQARVVLYRRLAHNFVVESANFEWRTGYEFDVSSIIEDNTPPISVSMGYHMWQQHADGEPLRVELYGIGSR